MSYTLILPVCTLEHLNIRRIIQSCKQITKLLKFAAEFSVVLVYWKGLVTLPKSDTG